MEVVVHIGQQKTASSSIQNDLWALRAQLERYGVHYSSAFGKKKAKNIADILRNKVRASRSEAQALANFDEELTGYWDRIIISQETLFGLKIDEIAKLHNMINSKGARGSIYAYVRRPDEHLASFYQQKVRGFMVDSLDLFIEERIVKGYYLYWEKLGYWADIFGRENVHVRLFDPAILRGSPTEDFLKWTGVYNRELNLECLLGARRNESLDPSGIAIARVLTQYCFENPLVMSEHFLSEAQSELRALSSGIKLYLSNEQVTTLQAAVRKDGEALAAEFLSTEEGRLFLASGTNRPTQQMQALPVLINRLLNALKQLPSPDPRRAEAAAPPVNLAIEGVLRRALATFDESNESELPCAVVTVLRSHLGVVSEGTVASMKDPSLQASIYYMLDLLTAAGFMFKTLTKQPPVSVVADRRERKLQKRRRASERKSIAPDDA